MKPSRFTRYRSFIAPLVAATIASNAGFFTADILLPAFAKSIKAGDKTRQEDFFKTVQKLEKARPFTKQSIETALGAKLDSPGCDFLTCSAFKQKPIALVRLFWTEDSIGPIILTMDEQNQLTLPVVENSAGKEYAKKTNLGYANPVITVGTKTVIYDSDSGFTEYEFFARSGKLSRVVIADKIKNADEIGTDKDAERVYAKLDALMKARAEWSKSASKLLDMNMFDGASGQACSEVRPYALFTSATLNYGADGKATSIDLHINRNCKLTKEMVLAKYGKAQTTRKVKLDKNLQYDTLTFVTADGNFALSFDFGAGTNGKPQILKVSIGDNLPISTNKAK